MDFFDLIEDVTAALEDVADEAPLDRWPSEAWERVETSEVLLPTPEPGAADLGRTFLAQ